MSEVPNTSSTNPSSGSPPNTPNKLFVFIRSKNKTYFEGQCFTLTSQNDVGEFDVLPQHANFVTLIKDTIIIDKGQPTEQQFEVTSGIINVESNRVDVYLGWDVGESAPVATQTKQVQSQQKGSSTQTSTQT